MYQKFERMLFEYIDQTLHGTSRATAQMMTWKLHNVKKKLLHYIFKIDNSSKWPNKYPILYELLRLNTESFFKILRLAFLDKTPSSPWQQLEPDNENKESDTEVVEDISRQELIDRVKEVLIDESIDPFSPWEINQKHEWPQVKWFLLYLIY